MTERSVTHATFTVERRYDARRERVFAAWADPAAKARWFGGVEQGGEFETDFRVGGREVGRGGLPGGRIYGFEARYHDIVPNERIVYSYDMYLDETLLSISLTTVEFKSAGAGTQLVLTEQGAFLDGHDIPATREQGMGQLLDALDAELRREESPA